MIDSEDLATEGKFAFTSTSEHLRHLALSARQLLTLRHHVRMGSLGFESLCHSLASGLQELSLRLSANAAPSDEVSRCRRRLLDCAATLVTDAGHPFKALECLEEVCNCCAAALAANERSVADAVIVAAEPALKALEELEHSSGYAELLNNVRRFGARLHAFLALAAPAAADLHAERGRTRVAGRAETVRQLLPVVVQSLRESLRHPMNTHSREDRAFFFRILRRSMQDMVDVFRPDLKEHEDNQDEAEVGLFIKNLDFVLDHCSGDSSPSASSDVVAKRSEWLVRFALAVGKVSCPADESSITSDSRGVLKAAASLAMDPDNAKRSLQRSLESLEQNVNESLLKLIIELFCRGNFPLDELIHHILNSQVSPPDRMPEDVEDLVAAFDDSSDLLFHVAHLSTFCTNDHRRARAISSGLSLLQELETELAPACLKLYFNPNDYGARAHLRSVRELWLRQCADLESAVLAVVDAAAFCAVAHAEARHGAAELRRRQYAQDRAWLRDRGAVLVRMCQRAVDFAWKELKNNSGPSSSGSAPPALPDDHPVVKVERSTWELQGALRLVLNNVEDLDLHRTMIRRVQVLVTCLGSMAHFLAGQNATNYATSAGGVRVLTSISRITIGHDSKMTILEDGSKNNSNRRSTSFRSVSRSQSIRKEEASEDDDAEVNATLAKLRPTEQSGFFPFHTRKMTTSVMKGNSPATARTPTGAARPPSLGFDFTEIFDELSALSHISRSLAADEESVDQQHHPMKDCTNSGVSLRHMALMRNAKRAEPLKAIENTAKKEKSLQQKPFPLVINSPERLRDIRTLDAKLAAIKSDLEGTEA